MSLISNSSKLIEKLSKSLHLNSSMHWRLPVNYFSQQSTNNFFGFKPVSDEEKFEKVHNVFSNVAAKYDLMNDVMSLGVHRIWKKEFVQKLDPYPGTKLLDVAGGTGDVAFEFLRYTQQNNDTESSVVVCDINENMMKVGQKRALEQGLQGDRLKWTLGDAMNLPFGDGQFDAYTIAFGIRNVVNVSQALSEAHRILKPGGMFLCLEFSQVNNILLRSIYDWYSFQIIPVLGEVVSKDWESYQYLVESIRKFPDQENFKQMIEEQGFTLVEYTDLLNGIATIHAAYKQ